ncbi:MAG: acyl-CoA thioesterase [Chitinispirillaceae bacterium]|nr:acyl-CoA thioesterase [Chitinispirillaceae bacterium]
MYDASSKIFTLPVTVEFEDIDSYKIVHNTRILDYLERARVRFLTGEMGLDLYPEGTGIVVYNLEVRFNKAAFLLDRLEVKVFVSSMDTYRLTLGYRLLRRREVLARASCGLAFMDTAAGILTAAPESYRERIEPYIIKKPSADTTTVK